MISWYDRTRTGVFPKPLPSSPWMAIGTVLICSSAVRWYIGCPGCTPLKSSQNCLNMHWTCWSPSGVQGSWPPNMNLGHSRRISFIQLDRTRHGNFSNFSWLRRFPCLPRFFRRIGIRGVDIATGNNFPSRCTSRWKSRAAFFPDFPLLDDRYRASLLIFGSTTPSGESTMDYDFYVPFIAWSMKLIFFVRTSVPNFRSLLAAAAAKRITWVDDVALAKEAGLTPLCKWMIWIIEHNHAGYHLTILVELGDSLFCIIK